MKACAESLQISGIYTPADMKAVGQLHSLVAEYPSRSRFGLNFFFVPVIVDSNAHVPNLRVFQMYAGLQLASELDRAVTTFREQGTKSVPISVSSQCASQPSPCNCEWCGRWCW